MPGQHHGCNEHELGQTLGDGEGQGGLLCCSPWGAKSWTQVETNSMLVYICLFKHTYIFRHI